MAKRALKFDPVDFLDTEEAIVEYVSAAFETGDAGFIAEALGDAARARGMTEVAKASGLSREQLYKSFSNQGNPTLKSTIAVMGALEISFPKRITTTSLAAPKQRVRSKIKATAVRTPRAKDRAAGSSPRQNQPKRNTKRNASTSVQKNSTKKDGANGSRLSQKSSRKTVKPPKPKQVA